MEEKTLLERIISWARNSITLKLILIFFIVIILLIPAEAIRDLVRERTSRSTEVINEINSKWGGKQIIEGVVLVVPYKTNLKSPVVYEELFFPEQLNISAQLDPITKQRGIYKAVVYTGALEMESIFSNLETNSGHIFLWNQAYIVLGVNNTEGVSEITEAFWNDKSYQFKPGLNSKATQFTKMFTNGWHSDIQINDLTKNSSQQHTLKIKFKLQGADSLHFAPLALGKTNVDINAGWGNPSFVGKYLPDASEISKTSFSANWTLNNSFNNPAKNQFITDMQAKQFGVSLLQPVSHYQKVTRATKYSSLFLVLTFLLIMIFEKLSKRPLHALQYLLVGLAMVLFYVLLLSISEYLPFDLTYLITSAATIGLIGFYSMGLFKNNKITLILVSSLVVLYGFLFFLLQAQDYSLLIGSLSLFALLALFMYLTRNINKTEEK